MSAFEGVRELSMKDDGVLFAIALCCEGAVYDRATVDLRQSVTGGCL
jgi:hypothetical protein